MKDKKKDNRNPAVSFRLSPRLTAEIRKESKRERRSPRVVVEMALEKYFGVAP